MKQKTRKDVQALHWMCSLIFTSEYRVISKGKSGRTLVPASRRFSLGKARPSQSLYALEYLVQAVASDRIKSSIVSYF
jgi:hypothetical protein